MFEKTVNMLSVSEVARKWGVSTRRVRFLCENGQIEGAVRTENTWQIPASSEKPADRRTRTNRSVPAALRSAVREVDALLKELSARRPLTAGELKRLRDAFVVDYTHASNAIEGNTLTLKETALALEGVTVAERPLKDHLEAIGHRDAFCFLEETVASGGELTGWFVRQIHALVLADKPLDRGVYRRIPVRILGATHEPPQPYLVEPLMEDWVRDLAASKEHPLVKAARFHVRFEAIHPFVDGNGRTGRLLANFILMKAGYWPVSVKYEDRRAYYDAFTAYHENDDLDPMIGIFVSAERARLQGILDLLN